jgi:PAS domain S-box-containing protein
MPEKKNPAKREQQLLQENEELRARMNEAEETLRAIREGEVDAVVVYGSQGEQVFSLVGAESIYRLIVETMKEAAFTVSFEGTVLFCNAQFGEFVMQPMEQIVGRYLSDFIAGQGDALASALLLDAQKAPVKRRVLFEAAGGSVVPAHVSANVLHQPDGVSICVVANDLTDLENSTELIQQLRRQQEVLQQTEARFRAVFVASDDAILLTDDDGVPVHANPAAVNLFGISIDRLIGSKLDQFLRSGEDFRPMWESMKKEGSSRREMVLSLPDGRAIVAEASMVANVLPARHLAILRDITSRKNAEYAILRHSATLGGINKVLNAALACQTEQDLGLVCLEVAKSLTQSKIGFIGELSGDNLISVAISNPAWDEGTVEDSAGLRVLSLHGLHKVVLSSGASFFTNDPMHT